VGHADDPERGRDERSRKRDCPSFVGTNDERSAGPAGSWLDRPDPANPPGLPLAADRSPGPVPAEWSLAWCSGAGLGGSEPRADDAGAPAPAGDPRADQRCSCLAPGRAAGWARSGSGRSEHTEARASARIRCGRGTEVALRKRGDIGPGQRSQHRFQRACDALPPRRRLSA